MRLLLDSLMELSRAYIKKALVNRNNETENKTDYTDSYPKGYFDLFGSIDDPTFVEPTELPIELDKMACNSSSYIGFSVVRTIQ